MQLRDGRQDVTPRGRGQTLGEFIEDHQPRPVEQRQHEEEPPSFPTAERAERGPASLGEPDPGEQLPDAQPVRQGRLPSATVLLPYRLTGPRTVTASVSSKVRASNE